MEAFLLALMLSALTSTQLCCADDSANVRSLLASLPPEAAGAVAKQLSLQTALDLEAAARSQQEARDVNHTVSADCMIGLNKTFAANSVSAALETAYMIDSFGRPPPGILGGNTYWLGSYQQCQNLEFAHYCLISTAVDTSRLGLAGLPPTLSINWGVCMPKQCTSTDVFIMGTTLSFGLNERVTENFPRLNPNTTHVECNDPPTYDTGAITALVIMSIFASFMLIGTLLDWCWDLMQSTGDMFSESAPSEFKLSTSGDESTSEAGDVPTPDDTEQLTTAKSKVRLASHVQSEMGSNNCHRFSSSWRSLFQQAYDERPASSRVAKCMTFFLCFSIVRNGRTILQTTVPDGAIQCLNGIRVLSICWVITGHVYLFAMFGTENIAEALAVTKRFTFQAISNALFAVDSFFVLSGLLVMYLTLKHVKQARGRFPIFKFYFHRVWRLTPAYMFFLMVWTTMLIHFGDGPLWPSSAEPEMKVCRKRWWTNLLYINNFYPTDAGTDKECMGWSWYLANDMQFYIVTPIIIMVTYKSAAAGLGLMAFLLSAVSVTTGLLYDKHYFYEGAFLPAQQEHPSEGDDNNMIYVKPYCRAGPYIIGLVLGYILQKKPHQTWWKMLVKIVHPPMLKVLRVVAIIVGWCSAAVLLMITLYGLYDANKEGRYLSHNEGIAYTVFAKTAWSIGLAWVVFACHSGYGSYVNSILSLRFWIPLSRLSYSAYLVHPLPLSMLILGRDQALRYQDVSMVFFVMASLMASFFGAAILFLAVEGPFMELEKLFFRRKRSV